MTRIEIRNILATVCEEAAIELSPSNEDVQYFMKWHRASDVIDLYFAEVDFEAYAFEQDPRNPEPTDVSEMSPEGLASDFRTWYAGFEREETPQEIADSLSGLQGYYP